MQWSLLAKRIICGSEINGSGYILIGVPVTAALPDELIQIMHRVVLLLTTILLDKGGSAHPRL